MLQCDIERLPLTCDRTLKSKLEENLNVQLLAEQSHDGSNLQASDFRRTIQTKGNHRKCHVHIET
jgi:hypothetical protein